MRRPTRTLTLASDAITVEGSLISPAMLARVAAQQAGEQGDAAYRIPKGLTLRDEMARYFRIGQALFADLNAAATPSSAKTIAFAESLLRDVFGFADVARVGTRSINDRVFVVTLEALGGRVPFVVVPPADDLDRPSTHLAGDHRRRSAASGLQDWLNANEDSAWGLCCNGERLRLLRDNASLTRPSYIEADLRRMFEGEAFADFTTLWLLLHASRFGAPGAAPLDSPLERWREAGQREGLTARERLRDGVEAALLALGNGFLRNEQNGLLRERVGTGALPLPEFFGQLLRLVYRLIFLLTAEDRDLLHLPGASAEARKLYAEGYSLGILRDRAVRRSAWDRHYDRWAGLLITFAALAQGENSLGLPALNGMFAAGTIPDLEAVRLSSRALMEAIYRLAWLREPAGVVRVNWRDMETEELGSVYESLLELTPRLVDDGRGMVFAEGGEAKGHARKTTGSYYTPDSLVQVLLDSALDPVLDRIEAEADDPAKALQGVTVVDPACGSGHFLLAAARRIATRLARARAGGVASAADFRHALRDVVRACIHGVDRNPMAVELTKVALWIETIDPGKPLGFLDANIRCGDALLGVFDLAALAEGIPDAAYKPLTGDDKATARYYAARNREERAGQGSFDFGKGGSRLPAQAPLARAMQVLRAMPEGSPADIAEKRRHFEATRTDRQSYALGEAADLYIAAFLLAKIGAPPQLGQAPMVPTTGDEWRALADRQVHPPLLSRAVEASRQARAFHWPLEFPDVIARGGFDVVLGNPPWERIKLQEQEFFAAREPEIAEAPNAAVRGRMIAALAKAEPGTRERALYDEFEAAKRLAEASSIFARESDRFPLTGRGDINTYALFAELFALLASKRGRAGVIVPTGIATDATTAPFFASLIEDARLAAVYSFENEEMIFPGIHHAMKFCLFVIKPSSQGKGIDFVFFARNVGAIFSADRRFTLLYADIGRINPNTKTAPVSRSRADAELVSRLFHSHSVIRDKVNSEKKNRSLAEFYRCIDVNKDSKHLHPYDPTKSEWLPLLEGKLLDFYDHRAASYASRGGERGYRVLPPTSVAEHLDPDFHPILYWSVDREIVESRLPTTWKHQWLIAYKDVTASTNERTLIGCIVPRWGSDYSVRLCFPSGTVAHKLAFLGMLNSITFDYILRQKINGLHVSDYIMEQMAVIDELDLEAGKPVILPRVIELTYTSHNLLPFALDVGYHGQPFAWNEERRAHVRAELDAWYARAYGLSRDELRYILDPADVKGSDYPSETFRVLKSNEISRFGEYRTARLVLAAYDRLCAERAAAE